MDRKLKKIIALSCTAAILAVAVYGNYFPLRRSQLYISVLKRFHTRPVTVADFQAAMDGVLGAPSPVGEEEIVRGLTAIATDFIRQIKKENLNLVADIMREIDRYYPSIIQRGRGLSFGQDILVYGNINLVAGIKTGDTSYLQTAEQVYRKGIAISPTRPQFLYALLDLAHLRGDREESIRLAKKIVSFWPDDMRTQEILASLQREKAAGSAKSDKQKNTKK